MEYLVYQSEELHVDKYLDDDLGGDLGEIQMRFRCTCYLKEEFDGDLKEGLDEDLKYNEIQMEV